MSNPVRHVSLVGPTASGKSWIAMAIARARPDFELVSVDSMQVYRGMDIGTAKPTDAERREVPHHLIDLVHPGEEFSLAEFQAAAFEVIRDIEGRGRRALLVGGTGLYLQAIVDRLELPGQFPEVRAELESESDTMELHRRLAQLDPIAAERAEPENRRRILRALEVALGSGRPFSSYGPGIDSYPPNDFRMVGLWLPREVSARRIDARVTQMLHAGWVDEVAALRESGPLSKTASQALGYKELLAHLDGVPMGDVEPEICRRTRAFARRQRVWFRRDPRITWFGTDNDPRHLLPAILRDCDEATEEDLRS